MPCFPSFCHSIYASGKTCNIQHSFQGTADEFSVFIFNTAKQCSNRPWIQILWQVTHTHACTHTTPYSYCTNSLSSVTITVIITTMFYLYGGNSFTTAGTKKQQQRNKQYSSNTRSSLVGPEQDPMHRHQSHAMLYPLPWRDKHWQKLQSKEGLTQTCDTVNWNDPPGAI